MKILLTGVAGFIGMHTARRLLLEGYKVVGIDNINDYYDVNLKLDRLKQLSAFENFEFIKCDIIDSELLTRIIQENNFEVVIHYAAQAGVRYSTVNPHAFVDSNIKGLLNILEVCKNHKISHLVYASSSSVYGLNNQTPFSESDSTDYPASLYGALKRSGELMAHSYSHLYRLPVTCLRFFTVYGPWGRPDQALALFLDAAFSGKPIKIFNNGKMLRDLTYIDDVVESVFRVIKKPPGLRLDVIPVNPHQLADTAPFKVLNVGGSQPVQLMAYIKTIEQELGFSLKKEYLPIQNGDMVNTHADPIELERWINFRPSTSIQEGVRNYIEWYRSYYKV